MEKLVLALIVASKNLQPYFQAHTIHVLENFPLRKVLQMPEASGRLIQWALELSQHDVKYLPRTAMKEQALANFISEFSYQPGEVSSTESSTEATIASKIAEVESLWQWKLYVDGSSNESRTRTGLFFESPEGKVFRVVVRFGFGSSNNEAEYKALLEGIDLAKEMEAESIRIYSNSQLVLFQVSGEYQAKEGRMVAYLQKVKLE